jgi:hypothetical protein
MDPYDWAQQQYRSTDRLAAGLVAGNPELVARIRALALQARASVPLLNEGSADEQTPQEATYPPMFGGSARRGKYRPPGIARRHPVDDKPAVKPQRAKTPRRAARPVDGTAQRPKDSFAEFGGIDPASLVDNATAAAYAGGRRPTVPAPVDPMLLGGR